MNLKHFLALSFVLLFTLIIKANDDKLYRSDKSSWGEPNGSEIINYIPLQYYTGSFDFCFKT